MPHDLAHIPILVHGRLADHAVRRLEATFSVVRDSAQTAPIRGIACGAPVGRDTMKALPALEIVAHMGVGYDSVDVVHAAANGIVVTHTPDVLNEDVADVAVALLLNAVRELRHAEQWLRDGHWSGRGPYPITPLTLRNRQVGILGMGRVGRAVARRLEAFGLPISYHNRRPVPDVPYRYHPTLRGMAADIDTLVSVVPSTSDTARIVDAAVLEALGPDGVFVNIGRGTTVDQEALIEALAKRTIAAAGLDVFADEPDIPRRLLDLPNAVLLPHVGSATVSTRTAMADLCVDNLVAWFAEDRALTPVPETAALARRENAR